MGTEDTGGLKWMAFYESWNEKQIKEFNIFEHGGFLEDCVKAAKKFGTDREKFENEIRSSLMYYYWCKCEWEIVLVPLIHTGDIDRKIDVYTQIMMNRDVFMEYVWSHIPELKKLGRKRVHK